MAYRTLEQILGDIKSRNPTLADALSFHSIVASESTTSFKTELLREQFTMEEQCSASIFVLEMSAEDAAVDNLREVREPYGHSVSPEPDVWSSTSFRFRQCWVSNEIVNDNKLILMSYLPALQVRVVMLGLGSNLPWKVNASHSK